MRRLKGETVRCKACKDCNFKLNIASKKHQSYSKSNWEEKRKKRKLRPGAKEANAEKMRNYRKTEEYKRHMQRRRLSGVEKMKSKRSNNARKLKPGQKLRGLLQRRLLRLMNGSKEKSVTVFSKTAFKNSESVVSHFKSNLKDGMTMENHGGVWEMEHTIPCHWYDHTDPDDVIRCWDPKNMSCMFKRENWSKGVDIPADDVLMAIGPANWPKSWNGQIPDKEKLRAEFVANRVRKSVEARRVRTVTP